MSARPRVPKSAPAPLQVRSQASTAVAQRAAAPSLSSRKSEGSKTSSSGGVATGGGDAYTWAVQTLNPVYYAVEGYAKEIDAYESGCGYFDSVKQGVLGTGKAAAAVVVDRLGGKLAAKGLNKLAKRLRGTRGTHGAANTEDAIVGLADDYIDITAKGSRFRNVQTSVNRSSFEQNLLDSGFQATVVNPGKNVVSYELNGARYVVRDAARLTGRPTADFYPAGSSSVTLQIRLAG